MNLTKSVSLIAAFTIAGIILFYLVAISPIIAFLTGIIGATAIFIATAQTKQSNVDHSQTNTTTLYVGNLPYKANETHVKALFANYGEVFAVRLMKDKRTGKRRGFGFVVMPASDAPKALDNLNEYNYMDRTLKVRVANDPKSPEAVQSD